MPLGHTNLILCCSGQKTFQRGSVQRFPESLQFSGQNGNTGSHVKRECKIQILHVETIERVHSISQRMASCEPGRTSAYSEDLRWRMVWQRDGLGYTYSTIAGNLGVDKSTVARTLELFHSSGFVSKRPYPKGRAFQKITTPVQLLILHLAVQRPGIYLYEIQKELEDFLLLDIGLSSICRFLHKSGFTRQRLRTVALQRDTFLREQYIFSVFTRNVCILR